MLTDSYHSDQPNAKVLVLFGGNPLRREEIIHHLKNIEGLTIIGTLSEQEGIETLKTLPRTDIVLIGGRYTAEQRKRIKEFIIHEFPHVKITEPGINYPYNETQILEQVKLLMQ